MFPQQHPRPTLDELFLYRHDSDGAIAYIPEDRSSSDIYHLRFSSAQTISRLQFLVEVDLVR